MTKFRKNHQSVKSSATVLKFFIYILVLIGVLGYAFVKMEVLNLEPAIKNNVNESEGWFFIPSNSSGQIIKHKAYALSYREDHEQSEWVAYKLTEDNLKIRNVERSNRFNPDYKVNTRSAFHRDYTNSGYTRGHLAPAGDMAQSKEIMQESFFMSNISPQIRPFNNGIWKELEETVRDWAYINDEIIVVTGPILNQGIKKKIGKNKVSVPSLFYKIILDVTSPKEKAIAFLIPHEMSNEKLENYVVTIDQLEELTGLDFFNDYLNNEAEEELESTLSTDGWKFSEKRFNLRVAKWNQQ